MLFRSYKHNNVRLSSGVLFNPATKLGTNVWIHRNTNIKDSEVGSFTYIQEGCKLEHCRIGAFCSIGESVKVLLATHPSHTFVSTSPVFFSTAKQCLDSFVDKNCFEEYLTVDSYGVIVGNDVWIGSSMPYAPGFKSSGPVYSRSSRSSPTTTGSSIRFSRLHFRINS